MKTGDGLGDGLQVVGGRFNGPQGVQWSFEDEAAIERRRAWVAKLQAEEILHRRVTQMVGWAALAFVGAGAALLILGWMR